MWLPDYKGSTFRGGFGTAFREAVCITKTYNCPSCILKNNCSYYSIFESKIDKQTADLLRVGSDAPHPFVLEPPLSEKNMFQKGEQLSYHLVLIGKYIDFLPFFIFAFYFLGERIGLGRGKGKFKLCRANDADGNQIYDGSTQMLKDSFRIFTAADFQKSPDHADMLRLKFLTPTRIRTSFRRDRQQLMMLKQNEDFWVLLESLYHRVFTLTHLYCSESVQQYSSHDIRFNSAQVQLTESATEWYDWERYSNRQQTRMKLGGFLGEAVFEGELEQFVPLFKIGGYLHIGKGSSFGLGKYELSVS